jgi:beta-glucosidase
MQARAWGLEHLDREERVLAILNAGCDQLGGEASPELVVQLLADGRLSEVRLNESARRILTEKFRLGLFDHAEVDVDAVANRVGTSTNRTKGLAAQRSSIVVTDDPESFLPLTEGINVYAPGIDIATLTRYARVASSPAEADVALIRIDAPFEERTEGMELFFRAGSLDFSASELERLSDLQGKVPTIVNVFLDRPALLGQLSTQVQAVTVDFGASDEALLDVLFGRAKRRGTLPFEISESMEQVTSRREDVSFEDMTPQYPYGHGIPS